jgi:hypothetical protein
VAKIFPAEEGAEDEPNARLGEAAAVEDKVDGAKDTSASNSTAP